MAQADIQLQIQEVYVSCRDQQINGRIYHRGEVVPGADALPTLPALLRTNRLRLTSVTTGPPPKAEQSESVTDLGSTSAEESKPKAKKTRKRRAKAKS